MTKPARATLLSAPFKNVNGQWRAGALVNGAPISLICKPDHAHLRKGDTVQAEFSGMEWRAR